MTYNEMKKRHEDEFNTLPIHFAFGHQQIAEELQKMGLTTDVKDIDKLTTIPGTGGFMLKEDKPKYDEMRNRHHDELKGELFGNKDFAEDAFKTELFNHEYGYTRDPIPAIVALGLSAEEVINNPAVNEAVIKAMKYVIKNTDI